jgi:hypothetical protein
MAEQNIVGNLFGVTPEMYQQQQNQLQESKALQYAQLSPEQQAQYGFFRGGQQLGNAAAGLLGVEDPQLQAIRGAQQLVSQFDTTTSKGLKGLVGALQQKAQETGNSAYMGMAQQAAEKYKTTLLNEATVTAKTREQLPNIAKLQAYRANAAAAGATPEQLAQIDAVIKAEGEGKAPKVNVNVQGQKNVLEIDKKAADNLQKMEESSSSVIERLQEQKAALEKGIIGGQFSDARTAFANALAGFGIKDKDTLQMLSDTKRFNTNRIELASAVAKQLGVNPTDRDFQASLSRFASANDDPSVSLQFVNDMLTIANKQNTQAREGLDYYRRNDGSFAGYQKPLPRSPIVEAATEDRLAQLKKELANRKSK